MHRHNHTPRTYDRFQRRPIATLPCRELAGQHTMATGEASDLADTHQKLAEVASKRMK